MAQGGPKPKGNVGKPHGGTWNMQSRPNPSKTGNVGANHGGPWQMTGNNGPDKHPLNGVLRGTGDNSKHVELRNDGSGIPGGYGSPHNHDAHMRPVNSSPTHEKYTNAQHLTTSDTGGTSDNDWDD